MTESSREICISARPLPMSAPPVRVHATPLYLLGNSDSDRISRSGSKEQILSDKEDRLGSTPRDSGCYASNENLEMGNETPRIHLLSLATPPWAHKHKTSCFVSRVWCAHRAHHTLPFLSLNLWWCRGPPYSHHYPYCPLYQLPKVIKVTTWREPIYYKTSMVQHQCSITISSLSDEKHVSP